VFYSPREWRAAPAYMHNHFTFSNCFWFTGDANPSPSSYTLPVLLGPHIPTRASSACYSMSGRPKIGGIDMDYAKTPGPGRYGVTTPETFQRRAPSYSMLGRSYMPGGELVNIGF